MSAGSTDGDCCCSPPPRPCCCCVAECISLKLAVKAYHRRRVSVLCVGNNVIAVNPCKALQQVCRRPSRRPCPDSSCLTITPCPGPFACRHPPPPLPPPPGPRTQQHRTAVGAYVSPTHSYLAAAGAPHNQLITSTTRLRTIHQARRHQARDACSTGSSSGALCGGSEAPPRAQPRPISNR